MPVQIRCALRTVACLLLTSTAAAQPGARGVPVLPPIEKGFPTQSAAPAPGTGTEVETGAGAEPGTEPVTGTGTATEVESGTGAGIATEAGSGSGTGAEAEAGTGTVTGAGTGSGAAVGAATGAESGIAPASGSALVAESAPTEPREAAYAPGQAARVGYSAADGFRLFTDDGEFELSLGLWAQVRYGYRAVPGEDRQLLSIPRARVQLSGHIFGPHHRYYLMLGLSPDDVSRQPAPVVGLPEPAVDSLGARADLATGSDVVQQAPLLDLWFDFTHQRDLSVRVGQFRLPFTRQRMIPDGKRQFMERPLADQEFQLDRDVGVMLHSEDLGGLDALRYSAGIFIGEGRNPSSETIGVGDRGFLYLARFEVLPVGRFDVSTETDFARADAARVAFGVAYALLQADATSPHGARFLGRALGGAEETAIVDFNAHNFTADALLKVAGMSAQGALHFRTFDGAMGARRGMGLLLSAGYLFERPALEPVVRYSMVRKEGVSALPDVDGLDLGLNYYLAGTRLRLTAQYAHRWGEAGFSGGEDRLELQLQAGL